MSTLLVVGGGLFGSLAAAHARSKGIEAVVLDAGLEGAASPAAAGVFREAWAGRRLGEHFRRALPVLEDLYGIETLSLTEADGRRESYLFVPPRKILEPVRAPARVTRVGDGWVEAEGRRLTGWVYVAAGIWCAQLCPGLEVHGRSGAAFLFPGEREGRIRPLAYGRQALAFVRDPGLTYFSDGTAESEYTEEHDRLTRQRAREMGLLEEPVRRLWGQRPYAPGGPIFRQIGARAWVGTGGRKMGTVLGASFARRLVEQELR